MEVLLVPKTIRDVHTVDEVVDEVDVVAGDGNAEEVDDNDVVPAADHRESLPLTAKRCNDADSSTLPEVENQSQ